MGLKKSSGKKLRRGKTTASAGRVWRAGESVNVGYMMAGNEQLSASLSSRTNGARKRPHRINPETDEQREKRLAARKALTLKAFDMAYKNHHSRKAS